MAGALQSPAELAARWRITPQAVRKLARALGFERRGRDWWFDGDQVRRLQARVGKIGRPKEISRGG